MGEAAGYSAAVAIARTIFAVLIGVSVAMLPAATGAAFKLNPTDMTAISDMVSEPMGDCCPHPCDKAVDDCLSMAACACFGFATTSFSQLVYPFVLASMMPAFAGGVFHSQTGHPPFRPPRA
jgi:hypothetical protein